MSLPSQLSVETVFRLQGPVEPDQQKRAISSFSVLERDDNSGGMTVRALRSRRCHKGTPRDLYKGNMSCLKLQRAARRFDSPLDSSSSFEALSHSQSGEDSDTALGRPSGARVDVESNICCSLSSGYLNPSCSTIRPKTVSTIYSHTLIQPICMCRLSTALQTFSNGLISFALYRRFSASSV
ncbi:hypothetical protein BDZ97DRAFT_1791429 [Flammula alnicola]|nr:hypothetical protein BDZ97DRAFT_1791429 [Flammula alnicola]